MVAIAIAFSAAMVSANRTPVKDVQSISGNRVLVPDSEAAIQRVTWSIDAEASLVKGVDLLFFPDSKLWKLKLFEIFVRVSCLSPEGREFICSSGGTKVVLPSHWVACGR